MQNQPKIKPVIDNIQAVPKKKDKGVNIFSEELIKIEKALLGSSAVEFYRKIRDNNALFPVDEKSLVTETESMIRQAMEAQLNSGKSVDEFLDENHKSLFERAQDCRKRLQMVVNIYAFLESDKSKDLRTEQKEALASIANMILRGKRKGYIKMPTGIGKTVIFTSLLRALDMIPEEDETSEPIKSLVVVPKTDLVTQTIGHEEDETGKKRGVIGWAPDLNPGLFHGDEKKLDGDIVVTTYNSFISLANFSIKNDKKERGEYAERDGEKYYVAEGTEKILEDADFSFNKYDLVIFDEAHSMTGKTTSERAKELPSGIIQIGFTATPDYNYSAGDGKLKPGKRVRDFMEEELYSMELEEAINKGLLSEVSCKTIHTEPIKLSPSEKAVEKNGEEYSQEFYDKMIQMESRNNQAIEEAIKLIESGRKGIISCIPGKNGSLDIDDKEFNGTAAHAFYIAQELSKRGKKAVAVFGGTSDERKKEIYEGFEKGDIDCICFVDMIKEGWDSDVARFLINLRPTKSEVLAKQRLGRVLRKNDKLNQTAVVVEFTDEIIEENSPYSAKIIFNNQSDNFIIGGGPNGGGGGGGPRGNKTPGLFGKSLSEVVSEDVFEVRKEEPRFDVKSLPDFYPIEEIEKQPREIQSIIIEEMIKRHNLADAEKYIYYAANNKLDLAASFNRTITSNRGGKERVFGYELIMGDPITPGETRRSKRVFVYKEDAKIAGADIRKGLIVNLSGISREKNTISARIIGAKDN